MDSFRCPFSGWLFFHNLQDFHGTGFDADSAGDAFGGGVLGLEHHDLHGAGFHALAAADALLLVDHVHTGLGILGDGLMFAGTHTLSALDAGLGLGSGTLCNDADAGQGLIKLLVEGFRAGADTLQARHTLRTFFYSELFHGGKLSFTDFVLSIIQSTATKSNQKSIGALFFDILRDIQNLTGFSRKSPV